ncbi:E3 ubiquitin-protein ligase msl-2 isoform X3 [Belonocnema kinseyi]|uniref:E3 ubiquitin-protein ligase msl-2 isoform X3 n=1 Tax=Belonocnema kinseyi TaxID=2817044 RepID=UPI00143CFB28|nr:E3 ubiquitin-protein ligase msl-2 isoform X3 [Belonocnema kinseyi]
MFAKGNLDDVQKQQRKALQEVQKEQKMRKQINESTSALKRKVQNCVKNTLLTQEGSNRKQSRIDVTAAADISAIAGPSRVMEVSLSPTAQDSHGHSMADEAVESLSEDLHDAQPQESPAIRSVSNGASIYSVMYAGSGNKITIKRKAAATEESGILQHEAESSQQASIAGSVKCISASQASYGTSSQRKSSKSSKSSGSFKKPRSSTTRSKRKGCRCGNATAVPGKLTCCGQRCPCYVESKPCLECRCRGCRNPHTADGLKIRPHIPELHNLQLQISTPLSCDNLSSDPLETVEQCLSPSSTTIQVLNVYSTPRLDIDNVPQSLPAALLVGEDAMPSTGSEAEDSDIQLDV